MCLRRARVLLLYLALCLVARPCRGPRSVSPVTFAMPRSRCSIFRRVRPFGRAVAVHCRTEPAAVPEKAVAALAPEGMTVKDGAAIIAGTALGGGFLALPSVTAPMGIMPSLVGLVVVWIFLVAVGTVYAEAAAYTLQGKQGDAETPSDSSVIEDEGVSVVSVAQRALGDPAAVTCSAAFALQMLAVVTAQVAKCGELLSALTGLPYYVGCILPSAGLGFFVFQSPSRTVEQTNTYLAAAMVAGFMLLILSTVASVDLSNPAGVFGSLPASNWSLLVPAVGTTTWALPIFFNLLCFGQSIPLVVERIGPQKTNKIRSAILLGSGVPLVMGMVWVVVSSLLGSGFALDGQDPVLKLLQGPWTTALPVLFLAAGAIGTTLIASYLALGQFAADAICTAAGYCSLEDNERAKICSVALPAMAACLGPQLFLPLLSFTGAFPTMLLYGLLPPLAVLITRSRSKTFQGKLLLVGLVAISIQFLLLNLWLWLSASYPDHL